MLTEGVKCADVDEIFNNVSIVCFNYDRCIEIFLKEALITYYKIDEIKSVDLVGRLNIIHPYGSVGHFDVRNERFTPLGGEGCSLRKSVADIRTFNEGLKSASHRAAIADALCDAQTLVFLGFAYHPINMSLLEVDRSSKIQNIFGTAKGMGEPSIKRVSSDLLRILSKQMFQPDKGGIRNLAAVRQMEIEENTSHDFLMRHFRGIT
ncbi:hypothetical protein H7F50_16880 [Novosphingobium flavum]|uniref:SIR2-like domain-containing protein n=1 Tax=Novosphingobium aerophilum TaxID=2839843 RepID=A0A7X1FAB4_9SPHN|nr:hypothetical protein [Novosphingobium aerophilum]MBC2653312.1 hypothetical protein [Novosphingobium aerophilum]MBC2663424.1 hypothetical protein [Novosphingobium aerophilum]